MSEVHRGYSRRVIVWSDAAYELVRSHTQATGVGFKVLISKLVEVTGNPRRACLRFVRRMGIGASRRQRIWTQRERQALEKLIKERHVNDVAQILSRSPDSVWHMLRRLGISAKLDADGFTKHQLAEALHVGEERIQSWIDRAWLKVQRVAHGGRNFDIINADDFCEFCKKHAKNVVGSRLKFERLEFVRMYVFPPSHAELLPVRASKKERAAYRAQLAREVSEKKDCEDVDDDPEDLEVTA